jgi:hypothetical protein
MWFFADFRKWGDVVMTNGTDGTTRSVSSLGELSRDVGPSRDLWPSIAAQIAQQPRTAIGHEFGNTELARPRAGSRSRLLPTGMQWVALAAVVSALAVGIWLGRSVLPANGVKSPVAVASNGAQPNGAAAGAANGPASSSTGVVRNDSTNSATSGAANDSGATAANAAQASAAQIFAASLVTDPRYTMQRESMIRGLEVQLKSLPPETQEKVAASLTTIRASMKDIQAALGRDPANALLQELLVNSYQDEMRVLTAVHEASDAGRGI